jgi:hypothetical protein
MLSKYIEGRKKEMHTEFMMRNLWKIQGDESVIIKLKITVFWDVMPCSLVDVYGLSGECATFVLGRSVN